MWKFLTRGHGETEGFSNGSLAEFKGNPLQALAREVCQNSLDASDGSGKPVIVEFENTYMAINKFPGMSSMSDVITSCNKFWKGKGDVNTITFLKKAKECLNSNSGCFNVLRISDYNTTGVRGAFSKEDITPWGGLVKGNAFSVKTDTKNAAGSYGIGKAAPFVSSYFQTVFYRTLDKDNEYAALGVARLMAHESIRPVPQGEDIVRRSVGYFGEDNSGYPARSFTELDTINKRTSCGTDLFIPGFTGNTLDNKWTKEILKEIMDNFLYAIYCGKLEVKVQKYSLNRKSLQDMLDFAGSKDARCFYQVIKERIDVLEMTYAFHNLGTLRLRLLFAPEMNKKVLIVRNSGMRIARISSLPKMAPYTGLLELQGSDLNSFFREMENPSHNAWEPKRHGDPSKAKQYKEEVENWVIEKITEKLVETSGESQDVNMGGYFFIQDQDDLKSKEKYTETITDKSEKVQTKTYIPQPPESGKISIRDEGKSGGKKKKPGTADPKGRGTGHRTPTGGNGGGKNPIGRPIRNDPDGNDKILDGGGNGNTIIEPDKEIGKPHEIKVSARIISQGDGRNKLLLVAKDNISLGRLSIVTRGENGRSLNLYVEEVAGESATAENGHIVLKNVRANVKQTIEFKLRDKHNYAMGVKAYGN